MSRDKNRYVVQLEMYIYADNDYMARKQAHKLRRDIDNKYGGGVGVLELGEQPFASLSYRKIDDHSEPISKKERDELPF